VTEDERLERIHRAFSFVPLNLYDEITKLGEAALGEYIAERNKLVEALREAQAKQPERVAWFRLEGVVFDKAPGGGDYWQRIAFIIYTDLCEVESIARAALAEIEESQQ
jgi:hypothetical protein